MVAGEGLEPTVLHLLCGENAAVGSAALTAHRAVIHYRLTLRVFALLRRAHNGRTLDRIRLQQRVKQRDHLAMISLLYWLREKDLNQRPPGYERSSEYKNRPFRRFMALSSRVLIPSGALVPVVSAAVFPVMGQNMGQTKRQGNRSLEDQENQ